MCQSIRLARSWCGQLSDPQHDEKSSVALREFVAKRKSHIIMVQLDASKQALSDSSLKKVS